MNRRRAMQLSTALGAGIFPSSEAIGLAQSTPLSSLKGVPFAVAGLAAAIRNGDLAATAIATAVLARVDAGKALEVVMPKTPAHIQSW